MQYVVSLNDFNGPLDVLLHLVKKENIDIMEISILKICEQYLEFINKFKDNLDVASEYLVMAAELIEMKSKILLPNKSEEQEEEIIEEKLDLVNRLKSYEKYKEMTESFKDLESLRKQYFTKDPTYDELNIKFVPALDDNISIDDLTNAFTKYLTRLELEKPVTTKVTTKEYSLEKRTEEIKAIIKLKNKVSFEELFEKKDRSFIVVTFLAILTMAKNNEVSITQENNFENIYISGEE